MTLTIISRTVVMMRDAARRADHQHGLAVLEHDGRAHGAQRALARRDRVGLALHQAEQVGRAGLGGEIVHLVVQQKPGVARDDLARRNRR